MIEVPFFPLRSTSYGGHDERQSEHKAQGWATRTIPLSVLALAS